MSLAQVQNTPNCAKKNTELFFLFKYSQGYFQMISRDFCLTSLRSLLHVELQKLININSRKTQGWIISCEQKPSTKQYVKPLVHKM